MSLLERSWVGRSVPVPVVPINFLSVPFYLLIYITIYILSSYRVSIKGYCPMKTYLEQLEQLERLLRVKKIIPVKRQRTSRVESLFRMIWKRLSCRIFFVPQISQIYTDSWSMRSGNFADVFVGDLCFLSHRFHGLTQIFWPMRSGISQIFLLEICVFCPTDFTD